MTNDPTNDTPPPLDAEPQRREAYLRTQPLRDAIPVDKVLVPNLNIATAIATVLAASTKFLPLVDDTVACPPGFDLECFHQAETLALALSYAQSLCQQAAAPVDDLPALDAEAKALRRRLWADVSNLCAADLLPSDCLANYQGRVGYKVVATDVLLLTSLLITHWQEVGGKCLTQMHEIDHGERLAMHILRLVGEREQKVDDPGAADQRDRAFTLLYQAYGEVRAAVAFLRRKHRDADDLAPSLYGPRKRSRKTKPAASSTDLPNSIPSEK